MKRFNLTFTFLVLFTFGVFCQKKDCADLLKTYTSITINSKDDLIEKMSAYLYETYKGEINNSKGGVIDLLIPQQGDPTGGAFSEPVKFGAKGNADNVKREISEQINKNEYFKEHNTKFEGTFYFLPDKAYDTFLKAGCGMPAIEIIHDKPIIFSGKKATLEVILPLHAESATIIDVSITEGESTRLEPILPTSNKLTYNSPYFIGCTMRNTADSLNILVITTPYGAFNSTYAGKTKNVPCYESNKIYALQMDGTDFGFLAAAQQRRSEYDSTGGNVIMKNSIQIFQLSKIGFYLLWGLGHSYNDLKNTIEKMKEFYKDGQHGAMVEPRIIIINCHLKGLKLNDVNDQAISFKRFGTEKDLSDIYDETCNACVIIKR